MNEATFVFGSSPLTPFYTLLTYDTNEVAISKTNPESSGKPCEVVLCGLEPMSRRLPPNDGLVSYIFPKLAAMLAIDQSNQLAEQHALAPTDRDDVQAAALQRAANQESCHLFWNSEDQRYELLHPAIGRRVRDPQFAASPASPQAPTKPSLHITVSSNHSSSPHDQSAPVILVTNPNAIHAAPASVAAGIRMSTVPQSDVENPFASLDLGTMTLHVDADQILDLMPSLFAIDAVVSAVLTIAVADEATNGIMANMKIWSPTPRAPASVFGGSVRSYTGSTFYATIAEREDAEREAKELEKLHDKDIKRKNKSDRRGWFGHKKAPKKPKQIVLGEFDLEKLGHYQSGGRKGQELPAVSRGFLAVLVFIVQVVAWILTAVAQVLAWLVVNISRALTSEKF